MSSYYALFSGYVAPSGHEFISIHGVKADKGSMISTYDETYGFTEIDEITYTSLNTKPRTLEKVVAQLQLDPNFHNSIYKYTIVLLGFPRSTYVVFTSETKDSLVNDLSEFMQGVWKGNYKHPDPSQLTMMDAVMYLSVKEEDGKVKWSEFNGFTMMDIYNNIVYGPTVKVLEIK